MTTAVWRRVRWRMATQRLVVPAALVGFALQASHAVRVTIVP